jgi:hypothetical protein
MGVLRKSGSCSFEAMHGSYRWRLRIRVRRSGFQSNGVLLTHESGIGDASLEFETPSLEFETPSLEGASKT